MASMLESRFSLVLHCKLRGTNDQKKVFMMERPMAEMLSGALFKGGLRLYLKLLCCFASEAPEVA